MVMEDSKDMFVLSIGNVTNHVGYWFFNWYQNHIKIMVQWYIVNSLSQHVLEPTRPRG